MFNITHLAHLDYWFNLNPGGEFIIGYALLVFFLVLFFIPGILKSRARKNKHLKKSIKKRLLVFRILGALGLVLIASRYSEVPYFSMRVWLYLVLVLSLFFLIRNGKKIHFAYHKRLASVARERQN